MCDHFGDGSGKMRVVNGGWMWHGWALQKWGVAGSATTPQIAGIEHRQLVHKVFWPAYATINAVKALRRRLDMQKKNSGPLKLVSCAGLGVPNGVPYICLILEVPKPRAGTLSIL